MKIMVTKGHANMIELHTQLDSKNIRKNKITREECALLIYS